MLEIEGFLNNSNFAPKTITYYGNKLIEFTKNVSELTDTKIEDIHLEKIYEVYDVNGIFITYKPYSTELLEEYLDSIAYRGYYSLKAAKDSLGSLFRYLNRNYDFPNVMEELEYDIAHLKPRNRKVDILSRHDILKFFQYIVFHSDRRDRDVLLFVLFLTTGSRSTELSNVKLEDISLENNTLFFRKVKHNKSLTVPLRKGLAKSIQKYSIKYCLKQDDYLFDLDQSEIRNLLYFYLKKAQLPKVTLHSMRHSFATMMAESGTPITQIQQLLGHADVGTTKGYVQSNISRNKNISIKETEEIFRIAMKKSVGK